MHWLKREPLEDKQVQRSLKKICGLWHDFPRHSTIDLRTLLSNVKGRMADGNSDSSERLTQNPQSAHRPQRWNEKSALRLESRDLSLVWIPVAYGVAGVIPTIAHNRLSMSGLP